MGSRLAMDWNTPPYPDSGESLILNRFKSLHLNSSVLSISSLDVPMGAKVRLSGTVRLSHGLLLLDDKNCQLLGGDVPHLLQEWRMQQVSSQLPFQVVSLF